MEAASRTMVLVVLIAATPGCLPGDGGDLPPPPTTTPAEFATGKTLFDAQCGQCHGDAARGTDRGPPLVHATYKPSHHADISFYRAVEFGVAAHHWRFGNMAPVPGVTREQVTEIVAYVRWLQLEAGIS